MEYQTLNPYSQIMSGIQTGMAMRGKEKSEPQPSDATIADPGSAPKVKAIDMLQAEYQDILKYDEINKKLKKVKDITPEQRRKIMDTACKSGVIKTPIVQSIVLNDDLIEPDETINVMKSIKNNNPEAAVDMETLIIRLGGNESPGGSAIASKLKDIQSKQEEMNKDRALVLKKTLEDIDSVTDNPLQWQGKSGLTNPEVTKVVKNRNQYLMELRQIDPDLFKEYYDARTAKKSGGTLKDYSGLVKNKKGEWIRKPFSGSNVESGLSANPDILPSSARRLESEDIGSRFMDISTEQQKERQQILNKLPKPEKKGQRLNSKKDAKIIESYMKAANGDPALAESYAEANGWSF
jgi:hypothetical protein